MKVTKRQLRKIVQEAILKEEPSDYYKDYRSGSISYEEYQQMVRDYERRTGGGSSGRSSYRRKTSYVGADANADKIGAIEAALAIGSLGISGTFLQAFAIGMKTLSSSVLFNSKIFLLTFSQGSLLFNSSE